MEFEVGYENNLLIFNLFFIFYHFFSFSPFSSKISINIKLSSYFALKIYLIGDIQYLIYSKYE